MAQLGVWYDGRYEEWDSYIDKIGQRASDERRAAQRHAVRREFDLDLMTAEGRKLVQEFE
jgi:hypothetical protein